MDVAGESGGGWSKGASSSDEIVEMGVERRRAKERRG